VINAFVMFLARLIRLRHRQPRRFTRPRRLQRRSFLIVFVLQIVLGILGSLITAWFSRQREFRADRGGAMLAGREADDWRAAAPAGQPRGWWTRSTRRWRR
jgi:heat shock protein HtpX